jgi:RHS repeat-associated protein
LFRTDPLGHTRQFTYDAQFNLSTETDPLGHVTRYTHNAWRQLTSITDPLGHTLSNRYNPNGLLIESIDPTGARTLFDHNPLGLLAAVTNPLGHVTRYHYDPQGRLIQEIAPNGRVTTFLPDPNGLPTEIVTTRSTPLASESLRLELEYDPAGRLLRVTLPDGSSASQTFSQQGHVVAQQDPLGRVTHFEHDHAGRLVRTLHPDLAVDLIDYDVEHRPRSFTNALGHVTHFEHDPLGRLTAVIQPDGSRWSGQYDLAGRLVQLTDPRGFDTLYEYDAAGRLVTVTNALLDVTRYEYNAAGHLVAVLDPAGFSTHYFYDPVGRLTQILAPDQSTESFEYDPLGRLTAAIDQEFNITRFEHLPDGQLASVTDPLGHVTRYEYDSCGLLRRQIDPLGNPTHYDYDPLGRLIRRTLPGGETESFAYDDAGQLVTHTDRNGRTATFLYDPRGRLLEKHPDPAFQTDPVAFAYDALGRRVAMTDPTGVTAYRYDSLNRLLERTIQWNVPIPPSTLQYDYDLNGNVTSIRSSHVNGTDVVYEYDPLNRLVSVLDHGSGSNPLEHRYAYDPAGTLQSISAPNGLVSTLEHDALRRLTNLATVHPVRGELSRRAYLRNPTGRRVTTLESVATHPEPRWVQHQFAYDPLQRLTAESRSSATDHATIHYGYDAAGNRLSRSIDGTGFSGLDPAHYSYDPNHRLDAHQYDAHGNTIAAAIRSPFQAVVSDHYDFENRLTRRLTAINDQPVTIDLLHNGDGWRVIQTVNGQTRVHLIDDQNPTGYPQVLEELVLDGNSLVTVRSCTYGHTILQQDLLTESADGQLTWLLRFHGADALGSTRYLTDLDATLTDTWDYDAFGNVIQRSGHSPNQHLFAGEWLDPHLGLYHLRARDYCPDTGRFWTPDPFAGFLDQPGTRHPYLFALNDPVNRLDPTGHFSSLSMSLGVTYGLSLRTMYDGVILQVGFGLIQSLESIHQGRSDDQILLDYFLASLVPGAAQFALAYGPVAAQLAIRSATARPLASLTRTSSPPSPALQSWRNGAPLEGPAMFVKAGSQFPIVNPARLLPAGTEVPNAAGHIRSFVSQSDKVYYRVFTTTQQGRFLTAVPPRSRALAIEVLALPPSNRATFIQEVLVPAGSTLQRSRALPAFGARGGAEQFELLQPISSSYFGQGIPLP